MKSSVRASILYSEADPEVLSSQASWFEKNGSRVQKAVGREEVKEALGRGPYDLVILGHTLSKDDRHHLAYAIKKTNPNTRILVLHASGHHPKVDLAIDSRLGEQAVLEAVNSLLCHPVGN